MTSQPQSTDKDKEPQSSGSINFPRLTLSKVFTLAKAVYDLGDRGENPVPKALALNQIGRKATGGATNAVLAASSAYGLTKLSKEKLSLTEAGRLFVSPDSSEEEKQQAVYDLLSNNRIFADFASRYTERSLPPSEKAIYLQLQNYGLTEKDAETFWKITQENTKEYSLIKELQNGSKMFLPRPAVSKTVKPESSDEQEDASTPPVAEVAEKKPSTPQIPLPIPASGIVPEFHFNIQIHLPENAPTESYDAIFRSIGKYLLGRSDIEE